MKKSSIPVPAFYIKVESYDKLLDGSIYHSGLAHQISLSNLAGEYTLETSHEVIHAMGSSI